MTHSSRPTLIFNSVISKITPVFSLRHVGREGPVQFCRVQSRFFFFFFPHTVNIGRQRTGEGVRKLKKMDKSLKREERGDSTHCMEYKKHEVELERIWCNVMLKALDLTYSP